MSLTSLPILARIGLASLPILTCPALAAAPAGQLLSSQCAQCHGTNGNGPGFDEIAGKSAHGLYHELLEMKYRSRVEGIMDRQARGYTDAQLQLISDYLSALPGGDD